LLPYLRNLFWEHMRTGAPLIRPLFWHYPKDPIAFDIDDQFMFGGDLLVAPILERGRDYRAVYFPEGKWYHFETKQSYQGGRAHMVKMELGSVPAFVREGAILPLAEPMQHTGEYTEKSITFHVFGEKASCRFFEDDGMTLDYQAGSYNEYQLSVDGVALKVDVLNSGFKSQAKYLVKILGSDSPTAVTLG
jgi:alpha-glucosidase